MTHSDAITGAATPLGLMLMGVVPIADPKGSSHETIILLGAAPDFWAILNRAPEGKDGAPDPVDRYSTRIVTALARSLGATPVFPFGGPPYEPFINWAMQSGRAWQSPTGMLVHDAAGLMISYRGALKFQAWHEPIAQAGPNPCNTCIDQPCVTACPVGALSGTAAYDVPACHAYLDSPAGHPCMAQGCATRRACPISQTFGRDPAQSAHHMQSFHTPCPAP